MTTLKVAVGTESALKLRAVQFVFEGLGHAVETLSCKAASGVSVQPVGVQEIQQGVMNRALAARDAHPGADFYLGIESGLVRQGNQWYDTAGIGLFAPDGLGHFAFSTYFPIPSRMAEQTLNEKTDLGEVVRKLAGGGEKDPMKYLSGGSISREQLLAPAIQCALLPHFYPNLYGN